MTEQKSKILLFPILSDTFDTEVASIEILNERQTPATTKQDGKSLP